MDMINIGIVGCGYWGPNILRNFVEMPGVDVVAVADLRESQINRVKSTYPKIYTTKNYHDLIDMNIDAVAIATPPTTHHSIGKDFLRNGKHVLVEKPLTTSSEDALDLCHEAREKGLVLMAGHTFEYNSAVQELRRLMENGDVGQVHYIDTARLNLGLYQNGLNALWDLAPHDISILLYLFKQLPISVSAHGICCLFPNIYDVVYITLKFPDDLLAHIHVSWMDPCKVRRVTVVGSKKMVVYNDIETQEKLRIYDKGVDGPSKGDTMWDGVLFSYRYGDIIIPNIKSTEPLRQECNHFIDCIRTNSVPITDGYNGYSVVKILETAQRSLENSGQLEVFEWDLQNTHV